MLTNTGILGLIVIIFLAILLFGPKFLPQMGRAMGQTLTELTRSVKKLTSDSSTEKKE